MVIKVRVVCSVTFQTDPTSHDQYSCSNLEDTKDRNFVVQVYSWPILLCDQQIVKNCK